MASQRSAVGHNPSIPPAPGGNGRGGWADTYRQGVEDGREGKPANPPRDPGLASAYLQGHAAGVVVAQDAEARAKRWATALGLSAEAKAYRRQQELAGPPLATSLVRRGRAPGAR